MTKKVIILTGPTASGKTGIAHRLAKKLNTEIINADSRQCFIEFGEAVAKPSKKEQREIHYHFVDNFSFLEHSSAQDFVDTADAAVAKIHKKTDVAIICGGTGLYIKAWKDGLDAIDGISSSSRNKAQEIWEKEGITGLQKLLTAREDPFMLSGEELNTARLLRAVEVQLEKGKSILEYQQNQTRDHDFDILEFALHPDREKNYAAINQRVEKMFEDGLWEEALNFYPYRAHKNLKTVGYQEIFQALDEGKSREEAKKKIQQKTRNYAKRQRTWYKNQGNYTLVLPEIAETEILTALGK